jgi:hypothetical protein
VSRRALSLAEVVIAALIVGVSAIPVLELVRSGTSQLEVSEIEAAARQLGSDVLERVAGPSFGADKGLTDAFKKLLETDVRWSDVIKADASLGKEFPPEGLSSLLDLHDTRLRLKIESPYDHPDLGPAKKLEAYTVTVSWNDRNGIKKEVTFARLIDL